LKRRRLKKPRKLRRLRRNSLLNTGTFLRRRLYSL